MKELCKQASQLKGGGFVLTPAGGWHMHKSERECNMLLKSAERILGDSDFVKTVIAYVLEGL
jgi:gentisate 1,2-dioxygenase